MGHIEKMLRAHPEPAGSDGDTALACIKACFECAEVCTVCADACLAEPDMQHLVTCIRLNLDCADICAVTGRLFARPSPRDAETLQHQLEACVRSCRSCGDECQKHAAQMAHCRICAEVCVRCAEACERMIGALVP